MRAAIYARYSSDSQRESSLVDQIRVCRQEAERLGYKVAEVFEDAALSGQLNENHRPGSQAMMDAAKGKAFDVLIVDDLSRLSRDTGDALRTLRRLEFWGVGLVARADGVDTVRNPKSSRLLFGVKSAFNEEFLRDLAEKVHRGMEGRVRVGLSPGGLPYGYRSEPIVDDRGRVTGHRRVIHPEEAKVVTRIFGLYADGRSPRAIAIALNEEGIAPPGSRWANRTTRQAKTWSYSAIVGHRRLGKGIINNGLYVGKLVWNKSRWLRDPDSRKYTYRARSKNEWVEVDVPELRIIPQDLWDRVQMRLTLRDGVAGGVRNRNNIGHYLLSGFVKCAVCSGAFTKNNRSYRCANHRNRGDRACDNTRGVMAERLERIIVTALRERLYTSENLKVIIERVRDELLERAKQETRPDRSGERAKELRAVEREVENIKQAVRLGKATGSLLEMLEDAERRRSALLAGRDSPEHHDDLRARLEKVLNELPQRVKEHLDNLETLLARDQVDRGKEVLAALGTEVLIGPDGVAEIRGDLGKAIGPMGPELHSMAGAEGFEPPTSGFGDRRSAS